MRNVMHRTADSIETTEAAHARRTHVAGTRSVAPYAVAAAIVGLAFAVLGAVVLLRADLDGSWTDDVVEVAGMRHTALLGAIWVGLGLVLLAAGAARSRSAVMVLGVLMIGAGIVAVVERDALEDELALQAAHGWLLIVAGALLFLLSLFAPTVHRTSVVDVAAVDDTRDGWVAD